MRRTSPLGLAAVLGLLLSFGGVACQSSCHAPGHHASIHDTIAKAEGKPPSAAAFPTLPSEPLKKQVIRAALESPTPIYVLRRQHHLQRFPCSGCHDDKMTYKNPQHFRATHGLIEVKHAAPGLLTCATCHQRHDPDHLRLPTGGRVSFDHSYQVCSSCHQKQARDWQGGAHGKRSQHWAGPKVLLSCTSCHNPHQPTFPKRMPAIQYRPYKGR